jgi:uncharacterized protein
MRFASGTPKTTTEKIRDLVWPQMGMRRLCRYYILRLKRLRDRPERIALGVAIGVAVCFTPLPGTHFLLALLLAALTRANILAAMIANWVGNPWTYPLMWMVSYQVGQGMFAWLGLPTQAMDQVTTWDDFWHILTSDPWGLMVPWVAGGLVVGVVAGGIIYGAMRYAWPMVGRRYR